MFAFLYINILYNILIVLLSHLNFDVGVLKLNCIPITYKHFTF